MSTQEATELKYRSVIIVGRHEISRKQHFCDRDGNHRTLCGLNGKFMNGFVFEYVEETICKSCLRVVKAMRG
jgi:hypothetical protein